MRKATLIFTLVIFSTLAFGQSKSVEEFRNENKPKLKLFFYKSTLKMFAKLQVQMAGELEELPDFSSVVKNIEKVKYFVFDKENYVMDDPMFSKLETDILAEGYESMMSARMSGANMNFMMKGTPEKPKGFVVVMRSEDSVSLIDIEGYPDIKQIMKLSEFMSKNTSGLESILDAFN
ncbi:DUF4252 domain-containing protein [Roseivirga echinicomitans]